MIKYKFIVIGSSGVGKTAIIKRLTEDTYDDQIMSTIGVEYNTTTIQCGGQEVQLQIWDTAGQEKFQSISKTYYRNAVGILVVYDITDRKSFDQLSIWVNEAQRLCDPNAVIHLLGNKADLESKRVVSISEALSFANANQMQYIETSAKKGENITQAFIRTTTELLNRGVQSVVLPTSVADSIALDENNNSSKCFC